MLVYKYNEKGIFSGVEETELDPLESELQGKDIYLLPPNATFEAPNAQIGFVPVWDGEQWNLVEDHRGVKYWLPEDKHGDPAREMIEVGAMPEGASLAEPELSEEEFAEQELFKAKAERADAVSKITVEVDGMVFDGDETSQQRMARSIVALEDDETMPWVLFDDSIANVTKSQLKQALRLAGIKQSELWVVPYIGS